MNYLIYSLNEKTRREASSGGFTREFLKFCIEHKYVDKAVCVRTGQDPLVPEVLVTDNYQDFFDRRACSVYNETKDFLRTLKNLPSDQSYVAVLLPCHVEYIKKMKLDYIKFSVEIICNYWPKKTLTERFLESKEQKPEDVAGIAYRGDGWPGNSSLFLKDGKQIDIPLKQFWSNDRPCHGPGYCQKCNRLTEGGDVLVGDPWNLPGDMGTGKTLVRVQNHRVLRILEKMKEQGVVAVEPIPKEWFAQSIKPMIERKNKLCENS